MDSWLRRRFWIVDVLGVGLCALLLGHAAAAWAADVLRLGTIAAPARRAPARVAPAADKRPDGIVARNVFCSGCSPLGASAEAREAAPRTSRLPLRVVAINLAVAPWSAAHSMAVLRNTESLRLGAFAVRDRVMGAVVARIEATRVELDHRGQREVLDLLEPAHEAAVTAMPVVAAPRDALSAIVERGVRRLGPHRYEVDRSALEAMLGDLGALSLSARAVPEAREGRAAGFRFLSVRPGGVIAKLGIESGDLVSSVNGLELTSPEQGLTIYTKLKSVGHVEVGLERGGRRISQDYRVR